MFYRLFYNKLVLVVFFEIVFNVFVFMFWFLDFVGLWVCSFENLLYVYESNLNNNVKYMDLEFYIYIFIIKKEKKSLN